MRGNLSLRCRAIREVMSPAPRAIKLYARRKVVLSGSTFFFFFPDLIDEVTVRAFIGRQFGVEGSCQDPSLLNKHRFRADLRQLFDHIPDGFDARRADENGFHRPALKPGFGFRYVAVDLPAVGVALDGDVE